MDSQSTLSESSNSFFYIESKCVSVMARSLAEIVIQIINSPIAIPLGISLGLTITCMILVLYLFLFGLIQLFISLGYSNPLNKEYMPYRFCKDSFFLRTPYFYGEVFLIMVGAFLVSIWGFISMKRKADLLSGQDKFLMVSIFVYTLWLALLSFAVLAGVREKVKLVSESIRNYNNFIYNNIYLNTRFLNNLREPVKNGLLLKNKIEQAIQSYCNDKLNVKNIETVSQVLFAVNYYYNLHKIGLDNPLLSKATRMLSPNNILVVLSSVAKNAPASFSPADYIYTNGMFIDDNSNVWWDMIPRKCLDEIVAGTAKSSVLSAKLNQRVNRNTVRLYVLTKTATQNSQLNNLANSIKTKDAMGAFFLMSLLFIFVYWMPVIVLVLLKPEQREKFFGFLGNLFGVPVAPPTLLNVDKQGAGEEIVKGIAENGKQIHALLEGQRGGGESLFDEAMVLLCQARQDTIELYNREHPEAPLSKYSECGSNILGEPVKTEAVAVKTEPVKTGAEPVKTETEPVKTEPVKIEAEPVKTEAEPVKTEAEPIKTEAEPVKTEAEPVKTEAEPVKTEAEPKPEEHPSKIVGLIEKVGKPLAKAFLNSEQGKQLIKQFNEVAEDGKEKAKQAIHQEINQAILSEPEIAPVAFLISGPLKHIADKAIDVLVNFAIKEANAEITKLQTQGGRRKYQRKQK